MTGEVTLISWINKPDQNDSKVQVTFAVINQVKVTSKLEVTLWSHKLGQTDLKSHIDLLE